MAEPTRGRLHGKTAIITGAARGIGFAIAQRFASEGARLGLMDVDGDALETAASGSAVNIASTHAFSIIPGCFPYPVAKHGLIGLTRSLAIDYASKNIRINAVAPGYIETDKVTDWLDGFPDPVAARQRILDLIPLHRIGRPEEVANAALFLASDKAAFCTGSILTMDGGRSVVYHD